MVGMRMRYVIVINNINIFVCHQYKLLKFISRYEIHHLQRFCILPYRLAHLSIAGACQAEKLLDLENGLPFNWDDSFDEEYAHIQQNMLIWTLVWFGDLPGLQRGFSEPMWRHLDLGFLRYWCGVKLLVIFHSIYSYSNSSMLQNTQSNSGCHNSEIQKWQACYFFSNCSMFLGL